MSTPEVAALLRTLADSPNNLCFVCGPGNPVGLRMRFDQIDGVTRSQVTVDRWLQGWEGITHGGIIAAILDEAMAYSLFFEGVQGLTGRMELRYRAPTYPGDLLTVEASIARDSRRVADVEGRIRCEGRVVAEACARFMKAGDLTLDVLTEHVRRYHGPQSPPLPSMREGAGG
jgi:acyl-coenzyme A thioesterase PaaI-like protein